MPMRRTRRRGRGPPCRTGRLTSPATKWWRRWTRSASRAGLDSGGVDGGIFFRPFSMSRYDASYAVEVAKAHPGPLAIVKPVDPDDPDVADVVADWKKTPGTVGIRIMLTKENRRDPNQIGRAHV